ncbi:uncharacterized protein SCHCODRAFT_02584766 [Schizophyllum commune H4-8]|nr:uncharacterized protein SCHCODRAFT_02584766 [Schizophyllum commune H4-8]KAI5888992.1 hypothetical protein SCHCODRAFT_02584766 [Schizophyllum commune H4-8]
MFPSDLSNGLQDQVIRPYIHGITPMLRRFSRSSPYKLSSYKPRKSEPYASYIRGLKIPARHGVPDFLLHGLGNDPEMEKCIREVLDSPESPQVKWLINTSGSGKTRLAFEALCLHFGFYITAKVDGNALGSTDLSNLVDRYLEEVVSHVPTRFSTAPERECAFEHNARLAKIVVACLLLARFSIFESFLELAREAAEGQLLQEHKRSWLLLQLMPVLPQKDIAASVSSSIPPPSPNADIFTELSSRIINHVKSLENHTELLSDHCTKLEDAVIATLTSCLNSIARDFPGDNNADADAQSGCDSDTESDSPSGNGHAKDERALIVLDEAQFLLDKCPFAFKATSAPDGGRPFLRQIIASFMTVIGTWPQNFNILGLGTGLSARQVSEALLTMSGKRASSLITKALGSFDDEHTIRKYVSRFVPASLVETNTGKRLLNRIWRWLRGRPRFLANFISDLIRNNYQSPHRVLDAYVHARTGCHLQDAREYVKREPPLAKTFSVAQSGCVLPVDTWSESLRDTFATMVASYLTQGTVKVVSGDDEDEMIRYGVARFSRQHETEQAHVDEPLVFLQGAAYFDVDKCGTSRTSLYKIFGQRIPDHSSSMIRDGFEEYILYITMRFVLNEAQRVDELFWFLVIPEWAKARAELVSILRDVNGELEICSCQNMFGTPLGFQAFAASMGIGACDKGLKERFYDFLKHLYPETFCVPGEDMGPDLVFVMRLIDGPAAGKLFWVLMQAKNLKDKLANDAARDAIRTVTPAHLGAAKVKKCKNAASKRKAQDEIDEMLEAMRTGFDDIADAPKGTEHGEFNVLRVMACTRDMDWYRVDETSKCQRKLGGRKRFVFEEELIDDGHPFATLNTEFIDDFMRKKKISPLYQVTKSKAKNRTKVARAPPGHQDDEPVEVPGSRKRKAPSAKDSSSKKPCKAEEPPTGTRRSTRLLKKSKK